VPGNVIGWLLCLVGLALAASMFCEQFAVRGLATAPGSLPAARMVGWLSEAAFALAVVLLFFIVLLFPDGRLPSRRWRAVLWALLVIVVGSVARRLQAGTTVTGWTNGLATAGVDYPNPLGVFPRHGWFSGFIAAIFFLALVTVVLVVASVFARRHGASAELRQQLGWLGYVGVLTVAVPGALLASDFLFAQGRSDVLGGLFWVTVTFIPVVGIPVACAVAVLRYRLYDLDVVVKKTVVAGLVAVAFTTIYALVVAGASVVTGHSGNGALAFVAAALAAVALQPI